MVNDDELAKRIVWDKMDGLIPAVVQDAETGRVLMLGYMNQEALALTRETGWVTFWSRSRRAIWQKGETSGNRLKLERLSLDCDQDTLLVAARPLGATCHTGRRSCFQEDADIAPFEFLPYLDRVLAARKDAPAETSYTARLLGEGEASICRKIGEEAIEVLLSTRESKQRTVEESADLLYHLMVLLTSRGRSLQDVIAELKTRHPSG